jgi:RNA polymerase sigma factor (sigma-70 family)
VNKPSAPIPELAVHNAPGTGSYQPGSLEDFDRLYRDSNQRVLRMVLGILRDRSAAEDCLQDTFVRALQAWPRWRPDAPAEAWLHRIALNVAISYRRRERLRTLGEAVRHLYRAPEPTDSDDRAWSSDLLTALRRLSPHDAAVIVLRFSHGYTNREIAVAFGVAESTISSRLATAKARLRIELERNAPSAPSVESLESPPDALYRHGPERSL